MDTKTFKKLQAARAKVAALEQSIAAVRLKELATLPAKYGFADADSFIKAVKTALGSAKVGRGVAVARTGAKRKSITPEAKAKVVELLNAGQTGAEVAAKVGISLPSVQKIKKEFGLVKARGSSASPESAAAQPAEQPAPAAAPQEQQPQY